jgi:hypothetical protein
MEAIFLTAHPSHQLSTMLLESILLKLKLKKDKTLLINILRMVDTLHR